MPARSFWKGYLKLSLVTCPVAMMPATSDSAKVKFHTLNKATGNRIQSRYVDAISGKRVGDTDQVKGYPRGGGDDEYVMLEDGEIDAVALDSTHTIDIDTFVPKQSIEWIWYDTPHYLVPDDEVGAEAFAVIREAMKSTGMVGISRVVLYRRERAVMLDPRGTGIVLWTLRYGDEVRPEKDYFTAVKETKIDPKLKKMVETLVKTRMRPWSDEMMRDPVQERLLDLIAAKQKGRKRPKAQPAAPAPSNVVDIMDALRRSLKGKS